MKKRVFIISLIFTVLVILPISIYAIFSFNKKIDVDSESGHITLNEQSYLLYDVEYEAITTGGFKENIAYYKQSYQAVAVSSETFKTDGSLFIYKDGYECVLSGEYNEATTYYKLQYNNVIITNNTFKTDGTLFIANKKDTPNTSDASDGKSINCYATEKQGYTDEDSSYPYLNRVGFQFNFKSSLDVYLRIEFKDAWKSHKTYITTSTIYERYIQKDQISGKSPFAYSIGHDWIYDEASNCAYYKYIIKNTCNDINDTNANISDNYIFDVNPNYWYHVGSNVSYREMIIVEFSCTISIVQANRAEKKWDIDLDSIGVASSYKA